jgi:HEAT repeat protein
MGPDAADAVPALTDAMRGTNIVLCRLAAKALSQVGRPALPQLLAHLRHRDPFVRGEAALALGWMGPTAATAVFALIEALKGTRAAGPSPTPLDPEARTPVTPTTAAADPNGSPADAARVNAATALGRIGPAAAAAVSALQTAAADPHDPLRQAALQAIRQIKG